MKLNILTFAVATALLSSCVSMKHTYRTQDVSRTGISVAESYVADLNINFNSTIKGETSRNHKSEAQAKQEAYYNAITANNVHVLVDPIYSISSTKRLFGSTSTAKVVGFGALYNNPRPISQSVSGSSENGGDCGECITERLAQLERFSKIEGVQAGLTQASYAIDTREGCCDGAKKEGVSSYGSTHLLHATESSSSLVDEFSKFLETTNSTSNNYTELKVGYDNDNSNDGKAKRGILSRLPIIRRFFKK